MVVDAFQAYIEQVLVPTLCRGDTVIMDNLPPLVLSNGCAAVTPFGGQIVKRACAGLHA